MSSLNGTQKNPNAAFFRPLFSSPGRGCSSEWNLGSLQGGRGLLVIYFKPFFQFSGTVSRCATTFEMAACHVEAFEEDLKFTTMRLQHEIAQA